MKKKKISILGSTGSIGLSTLKILDKKKNILKPYIFVANKNYKEICFQIKIYKPEYFIITNKIVFNKIKKKFFRNKIKILNTFESLDIKKKSDITICAIPGIEGLKPTMFLIKLSKKILIANKESIICGWQLLKKEIKKYKTKLIPIDSEHYSIMQLLKNRKINEVNKIFLTASGGPFLNYNYKKLKNIIPSQALKHPKWNMGKKISIDSATLMNKILELIEAQRLFNLPNSKLEILIHPNSLVHAIIDFKNGLKIFIYHETSMIIPIANAIFDGNVDMSQIIKFKKNNDSQINNLNFKQVDQKIFPIIKIKKRLNEYPSTAIIINGANEILVDQFLNKKAPFLGIIKIIMSVLDDRNYKQNAIQKPRNINQIIKIDNWAKSTALKKLKNLYA
tara:strand:+ start:3535 stop:4713 length:1179 start_codon:yes stop_codon:yes gene_type:complete